MLSIGSNSKWKQLENNKKKGSYCFHGYLPIFIKGKIVITERVHLDVITHEVKAWLCN